jgi:hypothetical protein
VVDGLDLDGRPGPEVGLRCQRDYPDFVGRQPEEANEIVPRGLRDSDDDRRCAQGQGGRQAEE